MEFDAWFTNVAIHHANCIKCQTYVNKRNAIAVSHLSEEALEACLLPKESRYFICEHKGLPSGEAYKSKEFFDSDVLVLRFTVLNRKFAEWLEKNYKTGNNLPDFFKSGRYGYGRKAQAEADYKELITELYKNGGKNGSAKIRSSTIIPSTHY